VTDCDAAILATFCWVARVSEGAGGSVIVDVEEAGMDDGQVDRGASNADHSWPDHHLWLATASKTGAGGTGARGDRVGVGDERRVAGESAADGEAGGAAAARVSMISPPRLSVPRPCASWHSLRPLKWRTLRSRSPCAGD